MKKILVTGVGGFVGSRVMQQWAGRYELCTVPKGFLAAAPGCHSAHRSHFGYRLLCRPPGAGLPRQRGVAGLACPGGS